MALNIDPTTVPDNEFGDIPDGKYAAQIVKVEDLEKTSQAGSRYEMVNIQFKIVGGEHDNRRVFRGYIYSHETSEIAGEIGRQGLKQVWSALGSDGDLTASSLDRQDKLVTINLKTKDGNNGYGPRQEITFVAKCDKDPVAVGSPSESEWDM